MKIENRTLPERPNLEQLRKQARELQRSEPGTTLVGSQRALAQSYGFKSWSALKRHVDLLSGVKKELDVFVEAALGGRLDQAEELLASNPALVHFPAIRALLGHKPLELDPAARYEPKEWPAILYVCFSRFWGSRKEELLAAARTLLENGADANAYYMSGNERETCLYGSSGVNNQPELLELLLEFGADPNDDEALYHSTEHRDLECLRLLLEAGGDIRKGNYVGRMLDHEHIDGLKLMLDHFGDPNETLNEALHHALIRGRSPGHIQLLLDKGVDPNAPVRGHTSYARAVLLGQHDSATLLKLKGASTKLTPEEQFLAACVLGKPSDAKLAVAEEDQWVVPYAAGRGDTKALRTLLEQGLDPGAKDEWGRTGLHEAGWNGLLEPVQILLEFHAPLDAKDKHHDGTPLNWAVAGYVWGVNPSGQHLETIELMLKAGAAKHCSAGWVLQLAQSVPLLAELLMSYGVGE